ncbi:ABC transporter substrate-binding protein [Homoserinimonas aerilata]|nr:ABC transporter substrate-binding protein [Homoserinimonas aerilata]
MGRSKEDVLRRSGAIAAAAALLLLLSGCEAGSLVVEGSSVTVAVSDGFTSYNPNTGYGSAVPSNASVVAATNSSFVSYDATPELVPDESFGSYEVVSQEPFAVRYTIADGVRWSDGVEVDGADLLLSWAANSTVLNASDFDASEYIDARTGEFTDEFPADVVWFDGYTAGGLQHATAVPKISGRSITLVFDRFVPDWQLMFDVGLPAHVVAAKALGIDDPGEAKQALITAVTQRDKKRLAPLSRVWNSAFNFTETPDDPALLVGNGPYTVTEIVAGDHLVLTANPEYRGAHRPTIAEVTVRFIADPLEAVGQLGSGAVDIVGPQPTVDVISALDAQSGIRISHGDDGSFEQLELQHDKSMNGAIEDARVRQALLLTVPRADIVDELVRPLQPDARPRLSHVLMPGQDGYEDAADAEGPAAYDTVDVRAAKKLLAEAAADDPALANPVVCVLYDPANPRRSAEFGLIRESAALAGIRVSDCASPDWRNLLGNPGAYDAALYGLHVDNLSGESVDARLRSDSSINSSHIADPELDELLDGLLVAEGAARTGILLEIDALLWAEGYGMPLYQFPTVTAVSDRVAGVERSPFAPTVLWNPWEWEPATAE